MAAPDGKGGVAFAGLNGRRVVFIGGGTCAGKTTLGQALAAEARGTVFSVDDRLGDYAHAAGVEEGVGVIGVSQYDFDEMWMRDPRTQLDEMLSFYRSVFPHVMADVRLALQAAAEGESQGGEGGRASRLDVGDAAGFDVYLPLQGAAEDVPQGGEGRRAPRFDAGECPGSGGGASLFVAEGIAFLPELLCEAGVSAHDCVFLTCEPALHDMRYAQRSWMPLMLEGCADPDRAFELWMARDELFAAHVRVQCARLGFKHIYITADIAPADVVREVACILGI